MPAHDGKQLADTNLTAKRAFPASENRRRLLEQQKLIQTSLDGFWVVDAKSARIIEANDAFCDMVGYSRDELLAMSISDLEANESPAETAAHIKKVMEAGYDRFETRHRHRQGHLVDLEVSVSHSQMNGGINFIFVRDITERKQAEALLVQREREFRSLAENLPDNIVRYNREGVTVYVNPALERTLGTSAAAMIGTMPREYHLDGAYEDYVQLLDTVLASGEPGEFEKIVPTPDGKTSIHQIRMVPERDENGAVVGALAIGRDITDRKLAEEALRASEQKFRTLAENMPLAIVRYDREGRRTYVNPAMERIFAVHAGQLVGKTLQESNPVNMPTANYRQPLEHTLATGERSEFEVQLSAAFGEMRTGHILIAAERAADGQITGAISIGRDITELKQAEKSLCESESRFRTLFESAIDCMLILDMNGRIVDINRTGHERLGYTKEEMLGRRIAEFDTPEYAALVADRMAGVGDGQATFESAHVRKDGTVMPIEINSRIIHLDGESRYFSVIRDITGRKFAEQQLREHAAHIESVREEEKNRIAREIHDELGGTLIALKMYAHKLASKLGAGDEAQSFVQSMSEQIDNALKTSRRIMTDLRPSELDHFGLMAALERQAQQFQQQSGIECRVACVYREDRGCQECNDCEYTTDKTLAINLFRILQEALTNVARHSGASRVEVRLQPCAHEVSLSISDNGCGLPAGHVVAPTSYGLRGMRERVKQLNGRIEFGKPSGGGFSVMVSVPQPARGG